MFLDLFTYKDIYIEPGIIHVEENDCAIVHKNIHTKLNNLGRVTLLLIIGDRMNWKRRCRFRSQY